MTKSKVLAVLAVAAVLALTGVRCRKGPTAQEAAATKPITIRWWRTFDDEATVRPLIEAYKALHPNVTIEYRKLRLEEYEQELLNALAEDRGPDILSIHATEIRKYAPKLAPLPPTLTIPFQELRGAIKKEVVTSLKTSPTLSPRLLKERFVDAVVKDVLVTGTDDKGQPKEQILALPLALDTLALFSNRDLLNLAGVPEPPKTWTEFQGAVKRLTKLDREGALVESGAALGASRNVERAADILALLMMQNGTEMLDTSGFAAFNRPPAALERKPVLPGAEALVFYTDFSNSGKEVYTWSAQQPASFPAFVAGRTAMMLGYSYHLPLIQARAPRMNLVVSKAPQIEGNPEVNFANYWVEAVSRKSKNQQWAWDFIQFATSPNQVAAYLEATGRPTALRSLVAAQSEKENVGVFASQMLTAKSWYRGMNAKAAEGALLDAVDAVLAGTEPEAALNIAAQRVSQTLR